MITAQLSVPKLAEKIGVDTDLYLKREDLHPLGSHKGRSIPIMIEKYIKEGFTNFVISSSGNAALAAARMINTKKLHQVILTIFVGKNIGLKKLKKLKYEIGDNKNIKLSQSSNPKQSAFNKGKEECVKYLRQSTDDNALIGYYELAKELSEIKNLSAVFIPTSSGTTAQGLYEGFKKFGINPQIHIVQTKACHPMIETNNIFKTKNSIASAIVDKVAHRKEKILNAIKNSHGHGWIVNEKEIKNAIKLTKKTTKIDISPNSALSIAGLKKAIENDWRFSGAITCLITGE